MSAEAGSGGRADGQSMPGGDVRLEVHTLVSDDLKTGAGVKQGHGDPGRVPVMVYAPAPSWHPLGGAGQAAGRRPVVAVPDTGVTAHPWLAGAPGDPVILDAVASGWSAAAGRVSGGPLQGHATFLAGLIRQAACDARVLSVPVMGDDGIVPADESLRALAWLGDEVRSGDPDRFVDVVCIAYGYVPGSEDAAHTSQLRELLWDLADHGVLIVVSAGNAGRPTPTFPAAFANDPSAPAIPVTSVGATNPDQSYAHYSNYGAWVTHRTVGSGVISTIAEFNGPMLPPERDSFPHGQAIDPDNFVAGFARWSGTSFAAGEIAGLLAAALGSGPALTDTSPAAATARATSALAALAPFRMPP
jgi:subtilisin family serine protease